MPLKNVWPRSALRNAEVIVTLSSQGERRPFRTSGKVRVTAFEKRLARGTNCDESRIGFRNLLSGEWFFAQIHLTEEPHMTWGKGALLWLLGIPLPIIILLALFWR